MSHWAPKYSDQERGAVIEAGCDRGVRPISTICKLAAAGELTFKGEKIAPFEIPNPSARYIIDQARKGREGRILSSLGSQPPKDAVEDVRRRLVNLVDHALKHSEKTSKRSGKPVDPEHVRKIARALREIAALPGPGDSRLPIAPGARVDGVQSEGVTRDSMAGSILSADKKALVRPTYVPDLGIEQAVAKDAVDSELIGPSAVSYG